MVGELWNDPPDEIADEELDDAADAFDEEEPEPDDELETCQLIRRYVPTEDDLHESF
jgi:hypothetical protein